MLTGYQNAAYAARYRKLVDRVIAAERAVMPNLNALSVAVASYYSKLMAYKDEYEVARLHADPAFQEQIAAQFEGDYKIQFHLAPPAMSRVDPATGRIAKKQFGPWMMRAFRLLARLKGLRGTALDLFGRLPERRLERRLIAEYQTLIEKIIARLDAGNHATAVALASIPEQIRGYGHVKDAHLAEAKKREAELLAAFRAAPDTRRAAE